MIQLKSGNCWLLSKALVETLAYQYFKTDPEKNGDVQLVPQVFETQVVSFGRAFMDFLYHH